MLYQMWHVETRNLMDYFDDEAEAFDAVRAYLSPDESGDTEDVFLMVYDGDEWIRTLHGDELAQLVFGSPQDAMRQPT